MAELTRTRVGLLGAGRLGGATARALATDHDVVGLTSMDSIAAAGLAGVVLAADGPDLPAAGRPDGLRWLPVRVELNTAVIGPATVPGRPGCPTCAATRAARARPDAEQLRQARERFADRYAAGATRLTSFGIEMVARLAADELVRLIADDGGRTRNGVLRVQLDTLDTSRHLFLPDPKCRDCGGLPDDEVETARLRLAPRRKLSAAGYRVRDLSTEEDELARTYVDAETGMLRPLQKSGFGIYPTTVAPMGMPGQPMEVESGFGRALDFRTARLTAVTEAIERFGGMQPCGKRTTVYGCYRALAGQALDPTVLGLYPDHRYDLPEFPFQRYHPELELPWVWGFSFARGEPVLVPESYAYYRTHANHGDPRYRPVVYEISNGCALGGCLEEAVLHGILELVERDAFLLTWYARLPVRQLDLETAADRRLPLMAERLRRQTGRRVYAFDITTENRIPSVWAMAVHPDDSESTAKAMCAAGSSFDPERAVANALLELAPLVQWRSESYPPEVAAARGMVDEPYRVRSMHDHSLLYSHFRAFDRLGFLPVDQPPVSLAEAFAQALRPRHDDLTRDLTTVVAALRDLDLDVVVVDQTAPEHRAGGFSCVKVIIPGMLPMTFGYATRRTDGLPRLHEVPHRLGYTDRPLRPDEINPHPHPFP